jgi:cephalosporin hydroxylase
MIGPTSNITPATLTMSTSLLDLVDSTRTDKDTRHSYLELYEKLLHKKKRSARNILEIGIEWGGSIKLWRDYFSQACIYGLDIMSLEEVWSGIKNDSQIILYTSIDAYDEEFFTTNFLDKKIQFDMVLDDGPHTLESMIKFIEFYSQILADDGILIIEDVQT